ncbi:MAG: FAD-dependent oxidoreductase [Candidatus Omnitrophica bacterium]|nr:FAD-dependent oxidoreductase [Candidatus Omnitrophota bacterium]MCF7894384.1 FAD-dependent oxidoreductase [Candidatus Omnitrophota bacterium]
MPEIIDLEFYQKIQRSASVKSFRFYSDKPIKFIPGQFGKIIFDKGNISNKKVNKYLSFSSSPDKDYLEFTKKLSQSEFSQKLDNLTKGDEIFIQAPLGDCIFKKEYQKIAFLVGGIGITPVISIIEYIINKKLDTNVVLFYSNRTDRDIAFKERLDNWQNEFSNIKVVYTITDSKPKNKGYIEGYIDKDLVLKNLEDFKERVFFIFGPPQMTDSMAKLCDDLGCNPGKVKKEGFLGY